MPNWTYNWVTITGDAISVKKVRDLLKGESDFDFNKLIPMPKGLSDEQRCRDHLLPKWYCWCREHWGTKWNACRVELVKTSRTEHLYLFDTAWSAPYPVAEELAKRCADLGLNIEWTAEDEENADEVYNVLL